MSCESTGSSKVTVAAAKIRLSDPDSKLIELCSLPKDLGKKDLTQEQVENYWTTDRANLVSCYNKHKGLANFTLTQNKLLRGNN